MTTVIEVLDGTAQRANLHGKVDPVTFAGAPALAPVLAQLVVVPFDAGADAHFRSATRAAAETGLDADRINGLMGQLYHANAGAPTQANPIAAGAFAPYKGVVAALFGGAVLNLPTAANASAAVKQLAFARTPSLDVKGVSGGLAWSGKATLEIRQGHVVGAPKLYGWSFLSLTWWSWLLWAAALGVWIARLSLKPEKHHPTWDRFKWIGWVAGPLVLLLVLLLWDNEVHAVFGASALRVGTSSMQVFLAFAGLELATFAYMSFAAIAPLRMLLRNGSLLLRQGTFMGLTGAIAALLGFLLGATLLRSFLDLVVSKVLASIS
jgi:hypothetical protein